VNPPPRTLHEVLPFIALALSALPHRRILSDDADIEKQHMQTWVRLDAVLELLEKSARGENENGL
jgi:hypothetical protein